MDYTYSKESRAQGRLFMDNQGKEDMLQSVQPDACEDGPGTCRPCLLSALMALWSEQHVQVSKKDSCPQRSVFFLSEWVRLTFEKFLQGLRLREFEQNVGGFSAVAMGGGLQLGGSYQRYFSLFLHQC